MAIGLAAGTLGGTAAGATAPSDVVAKNAATPAEQAIQFWTPDRIKLATDYDDGLDLSTKGIKASNDTLTGRPARFPDRRREEDHHEEQARQPAEHGRPRVLHAAEGRSARPEELALLLGQLAAGQVPQPGGDLGPLRVRHQEEHLLRQLDLHPVVLGRRQCLDRQGPYGIYAAKTFNAHDDFVVKEDYDYDYAFVNVYNGIKVNWEKVNNRWQWTVKNAGRLGDNVGGQGFTWNRSTKLNVFSFGYPAGEHPDGDKPFTGRTMKYCYGKSKAMPEAKKYNLQEHIGVKCAFTAGASGGPLIYNYKSASRTGYLVGVNSVAWDTDGNDRYDHISSPYFNTDTYNVYKAAANRWTGNMP
ncbi:trypsin-like serine peptidase [Nonomuraea antimicrobica]